jgi:hypothetical protein
MRRYGRHFATCLSNVIDFLSYLKGKLVHQEVSCYVGVSLAYS